MREQESPIARPMSWSLSTYSLICYGDPAAPIFRKPTGIGTFPKERMFEYTSDRLRSRHKNDVSLLAKLPALIVAEAIPGGIPKTPAFLAQIEDVHPDGNDIRFQYRRMETGGFSSEEVFAAAWLNSERREHSRTHWAIKDGSLIEGLFCLLADRVNIQEELFPSIAKPRVFNLEEWPLRILPHVAVMMPFDSAYEAVYEAIRRACRHHNLCAIRVDEIFGPSNVVDDIFKFIVQSKLVISDLTTRNPNVLYETGIAHARNRDVLMIVQNEDDIPFDLQHIRFVRYLPNSEGYNKLQTDLVQSISAILHNGY